MISFGFGEMIHLHIEGTKYIPGIIVPSIVVLLSARGGTRQATINEQASTQVYTYTGGRGTRQAITKTNIYTPAGVSGLQTSEHQNSIHRGGGGGRQCHTISYPISYIISYAANGLRRRLMSQYTSIYPPAQSPRRLQRPDPPVSESLRFRGSAKSSDTHYFTFPTILPR